MIKEEKVLININSRNKKIYEDKGYVINGNNLEVNINDLTDGSKTKITVICDICGSETTIMYSKYILNKKRNNKNYYSCFKCKNIEKEKTCLSKYGVVSYSMTDEFKKSESEKWKGKIKGFEKYKKTMIERYGVDCYFKTDEMKIKNKEWMSSVEFKEKSRKTIIDKYGFYSFSKTDGFKKIINDNKELINEKIKKTFKEKYGVEYYSNTLEWKNKMKLNKEEIINKIKETCLTRYGVSNISKLQNIQNKIKKSKIENGVIIPNELLSEWYLYKNDVRKLTNRNKKELYEKWNGNDYYDDERIIGYLSLSYINRFYPTIDHKISVYYGFINNIPPEHISDLSNLCITKRYINSTKNKKIEEDFNL